MMKWLLNRRVAGVLLAFWCLLIFVLSSVPGNNYPEVHFEGADKIVHLNLYFFVGLLASIYFRPQGPHILAPLMFGILYGLSDEIHQLFVPLRSFSFYDLLADAAGVVVGVTIYTQYLARFFSFHQPRDDSFEIESGNPILKKDIC